MTYAPQLRTWAWNHLAGASLWHPAGLGHLTTQEWWFRFWARLLRIDIKRCRPRYFLHQSFNNSDSEVMG